MRSILPVLSSLLIGSQAAAANIDVIGLFPGKAVLVVDANAPKTFSVGNIVLGDIRLVGVTSTSATLEQNGKRQTLALGEHVNRSAPSGRASITLQPDGRGHYIVHGQINGGTVRMLVDTGASLVAMSADDAVRLGIDYKKGQQGHANTANGLVTIYRVTLNHVKVGDIQLNQVAASVQEHGLPFTLLGMSFLNRTEIRREGEQLTLTKRF